MAESAVRPPADETVWPGLESSPGATRPDQAPPAAPPPAAAQPAAAASPAPPTSGGAARPRGGSGGSGGGWITRHRGLAAALGAAALVAIIAVVIVLAAGGGSDSGTPAANAASFPATLTPIPTNRVTGDGDATVKLNGDTATVSIDTKGLLDSAPHAMHIHAGGQAKCPPASAAHTHNGQQAISTVNGEPFYGPPVASMTTKGDIGKDSILAFPRYPHEGNIKYTRTVTLPHSVAQDIRDRKASMIVHGIDFNSNGLYDSVLDRSELDRHLPGEATAPGLCGPILKSTNADAGGAEVYTASLSRQPAEPAGDRLWLCHVPARRQDTAGT
jgi:hypothetical protein